MAQESGRVNTKRRIKAVLFDLDGVLIDSIDAWYVALNETLRKFGKKKIGKGEYVKKCWGFSLSRNLKRFGLGRKAVEYCLSKYKAHLDEVKVIPGAHEVLERLKRRFRLAVVTNTPSSAVKRILESFGLEKYFETVITGDDVRKTKPNPEAVRKACRRLGVHPFETILVGDTKSDVLAGRNAKGVVIGVGVDGDFRIEKLSQLPELLNRISRSY